VSDESPPAFSPPSLPNVRARLIVTSVRGETSTNIQLPFKTVEEGKRAQEKLQSEFNQQHPYGTAATTILHCAGRTTFMHPGDIIAMTLIDRTEEDASRLIDVRYEKWIEEQTEEAQKGSAGGFGIGR